MLTRQLIAAILMIAGFSFEDHASAASLETLYDFCSQARCADGDGPLSAVLMDASGNLYGTTLEGGAYNHGAVFQLRPNATNSGWTETLLHSFCPPGPICADGAAPYGGLVMDASGNLYGTTPTGGAHGHGTIFKLTPNAMQTSWTFTVLYSFGSNSSGDGDGAYAGLVMDPTGRLYGTTYYGGTDGAGAVFGLTPNAAKTVWTETVLYSFGTNGGKTDASSPYAGLILDASGNLYGTTLAGGHFGAGTVFKLTPPNTNTPKWSEEILYDLCSQGGAKCTDGSDPVASLLMDASGNLYGTAYKGGAHSDGVVFELTPNAAKTAWTQTVLWSFGATGDGAEPWADVIMDGSGRLYGTTLLGGAHGAGTIFALTPNTTKTAWTETVRYSFCTVVQASTCLDGTEPYAGLIMDKLGNLYGTTFGSGAHFGGTIFRY
jgi:uncharacterized repeat protein (TIGR03803 family)